MTITVTQLNNYISGLLDTDGQLQFMSVCGEITNLKRSRDGWYFSLKDDNAQIDCFAYESVGELTAGVTAVAEGSVSYYAKLGRISLFVRRLTATDKTGAQYLQFVELRNKLAQEGLFAEERKKQVPSCCKTVGVVTSENGAVIHDITNVALRRQPFTNILLYPVKVQGQGADNEIAEGIKYFSESAVDVVIVARGGGSNEDLSAFNSEIVVRAVAECKKPVVSAIGHGIDYTLCDFVSDKRAVTPSEAAEFVTLDVAVLKRRILQLLAMFNGTVTSKIRQAETSVEYNSSKIIGTSLHKVEIERQRVKDILKTISVASQTILSERSYSVDSIVSKLNSANPAKLLQRGYAYVNCGDDKVLSATQLHQNDQVEVTLVDGKFSATVTEVIK